VQEIRIIAENAKGQNGLVAQFIQALLCLRKFWLLGLRVDASFFPFFFLFFFFFLWNVLYYLEASSSWYVPDTGYRYRCIMSVSAAPPSPKET
jgi:hypothetical protein